MKKIIEMTESEVLREKIRKDKMETYFALDIPRFLSHYNQFEEEINAANIVSRPKGFKGLFSR